MRMCEAQHMETSLKKSQLSENIAANVKIPPRTKHLKEDGQDVDI